MAGSQLSGPWDVALREVSEILANKAKHDESEVGKADSCHSALSDEKTEQVSVE
jgi:hypothetical protein